MSEADDSEFDLEKMLHARSTTPEDAMPRCPECESVKIHRRVGGPQGRHARGDHEYWCDYCNTSFDEPAGGTPDA